MHKMVTETSVLAHLVTSVIVRVIVLETVFPGICVVKGCCCNELDGSRPAVEKTCADGLLEKGEDESFTCLLLSNRIVMCVMNFVLEIWIISTRDMFSAVYLFRITVVC